MIDPVGGIRLTPEYQIDKVFTRSRAEVTKFSQCATYCFIKYVKESVNGNWLAAYSKGFREEVYKFFSPRSWTEVSQRVQR